MNNKNNRHKLILPIFVLTFFGCKKVIDVKLDDTTPQTVITGEVNNGAGPYTVTISTTVNYTADNVYPPVSGALAIISGNGKIDTLSETSPGTYKTHSLVGKPGAAYSLYVSTGGQVYTASSVMPQPVALDSIGFTTSGTGDTTINAVAYFQDPAGIPNHYRFLESVNGKYFANSRGLYVFDDRLSDGRYISNTIRDDSTDIRLGDTMMLKMDCIDLPVYNYWYSLSQITGGNGLNAVSPANPTSNISNNALGYFSANTKQVKTAVVHK